MLIELKFCAVNVENGISSNSIRIQLTNSENWVSYLIVPLRVLAGQVIPQGYKKLKYSVYLQMSCGKKKQSKVLTYEKTSTRALSITTILREKRRYIKIIINL